MSEINPTSPAPEGAEQSPAPRRLSKYALEVRVEILAALDGLPLPSDVAEYSAWWKQLDRPADSRASLEEYRTHLEARGLELDLIDQRITVVRNYVQLFKSPPAVNATYSFPPSRLFPPFQRFGESMEEWGVRADAEYQRLRAKHMADLKAWKPKDEEIIGRPIAEPKPRRVPGEKGQTFSFADRCKLAAERLLGRSWKDIAFEYLEPGPDEVRKATDKVRRSATAILQTAGFEKSDRLPGETADKNSSP